MNTKTVKKKLEKYLCYNCNGATNIDNIDKLYRKELLKEKWEVEIKYHSLPRISYTCCNIEVSEPKGTEVMCPECKEWVTTK